MTLLPEHTRRLVTDGVLVLPGDDHACEGARFHSPEPLVTHEVTYDERTAYLCGTCVDKVTVLLAIFDHFAGDVPWLVRREYGNDLRVIAKTLYRNKT